MRSTASVEPQRVRRLNALPGREKGRYVLYWMQSAQRTEENPALEFAVQRANELALPLVVAFILTPDYPEANLRHYTFMVEGLFESMTLLRMRGALPRLELGFPPDGILRLSEGAAEIVVDRGYLRHLKAWYGEVAEKCGTRLWQVETEAAVPVELASEKLEYAARTLRPRIHRYLDEFTVRLLPSALATASDHLDLEGFSAAGLEPAEFLRSFPIDRSVKPVGRFFQGGQRRAKELFDDFLESRLTQYESGRNQPHMGFTSTMSPYLHFGMVSPLYLLTELVGRGEYGSENGASYIEELVVRRGLSFNFVNFENCYDSFRCLPGWAARTLAHHASDPRPFVLCRENLEAAETPDPYWNAAQVEMVETGYMHNYMRMYWGKKILEWSVSPEEAFQTTLYLNNKYLLDGRDPASFANVAWVYGVHDRAWPERAVYGKVRCMMASGLERKSDPAAYLKKIEDITGREVLSMQIRSSKTSFTS